MIAKYSYEQAKIILTLFSFPEQVIWAEIKSKKLSFLLALENGNQNRFCLSTYLQQCSALLKPLLLWKRNAGGKGISYCLKVQVTNSLGKMENSLSSWCLKKAPTNLQVLYWAWTAAVMYVFSRIIKIMNIVIVFFWMFFISF